ncbi:MAG: hypothetical protein AMXMBFR36_30630 [Acidobacteriota bacterium]
MLDARVNEALARVASGWRGPEDRWRFAVAVWKQLGGVHWVDRIERFAMRSPEVEKLPQYRWRSIFAGAPLRARRVNFVFGVGRTIRLADSLVGSDKLGHFFSQGLKYYRSGLDGWSEERIAGRGRFNERWLFGQLTTSVYSNADLVANWEGYLFYRSLFEGDVVSGKGPIVGFEHGEATIARRFSWRDHVNDYWDEALHPSHWSPRLERALRPKLEALCAELVAAGAPLAPRGGPALASRYAHLGLRSEPENRLEHLCATGDAQVSGAPTLRR